MTDHWIERFAGLRQLPAAEKTLLSTQSASVTVPDGAEVFGVGSRPDQFFLIVSGCVRVQQLSEWGREIVLYRVRAGESCVMTTACLLTQDAYAAQGVAESDVDAVAIPQPAFDRLIADSPAFRAFVFSAYSARIGELCRVVEEVAFQRLDVRLAAALLTLADVDDTVHTTHQKLSVELGTAREVVSRLLAEFQRREWISVSRGSVALHDVAALRQLAGER